MEKGGARGLKVPVLLLEARQQETGGFTSCHHGLNGVAPTPPDTISEDTQREQGHPTGKFEPPEGHKLRSGRTLPNELGSTFSRPQM